ncbi:hypothetical protein I5Q34_16600 [Streptomyces sp. AV19]|uniref:hypothetical protein n=1 Tax=Streptomyces sp. AV19 TaxID=2793068 RepID=UPI0018FE39A3|nr:hypothetical protein [Streptomyces sp. AV19]MBH1935868.1 hypothetical protein [Streptomyces sp. AV19]MDG4534348.1 hypothetical protein [Streptomyces sp. AV19]
MASHARHALRPPSRLPRSLTRAGVTLSASAAIAVGAASAASADPVTPPSGPTLHTPASPARAQLGQLDLVAARDGAMIGLQHATAPLAPILGRLPVNPFARTGIDPLNNTVGTKIGDLKPVSSRAVTGPLSDGGKLHDVPGLNLLPLPR